MRPTHPPTGKTRPMLHRNCPVVRGRSSPSRAALPDSPDRACRRGDGNLAACASKWVNRHRRFGEAGLLDRPSARGRARVRARDRAHGARVRAGRGQLRSAVAVHTRVVRNPSAALAARAVPALVLPRRADPAGGHRLPVPPPRTPGPPGPPPSTSTGQRPTDRPRFRQEDADHHSEPARIAVLEAELRLPAERGRRASPAWAIAMVGTGRESGQVQGVALGGHRLAEQAASADGRCRLSPS